MPSSRNTRSLPAMSVPSGRCAAFSVMDLRKLAYGRNEIHTPMAIPIPAATRATRAHPRGLKMLASSPEVADGVRAPPPLLELGGGRLAPGGSAEGRTERESSG